MSYTAGNLELNVLGISDGAVTSIRNTAKALNSLYNSIKKINGINLFNTATSLNNIFSNLSRSINKLDTSSLEKLANISSSVKAFSGIAKLEKIDYDKVTVGFGRLTTAITPFIEKVQSAETSLTSLYGILSKSSGKKIRGILDTSGTSSKNKGAFGFLNIARWGATLYSARRLGRVVADIAQSGADYTETLNLWETAMGTNVTLATEFVKKMNEAYGISEKTLMNAQATFKNMLGGLGNITDQMAYALSEGITQMAVDYASLYNQTFEQAFTKFQAALAGQVRPIRSVSGFDITEQTLFSLYQSLGGTKTMRQLNRTEKQLLSILAIFQQMSSTGAVGDLNKTMESFANQSRVMAESWQQVVSYAGVLLTYTIQESGLLTYVNAILIFIGDTLKAVAESMGAIQHFGDVFQATTDGALGASEAIDEVQGKLLDFDKFRSLSGAEENVLGLDEKLLNALSNFESILANASMEARELAYNWKIASGLFDKEGMFDVGEWDSLIEEIESFFHLLLAIIVSKAIPAIVNGIKSITFSANALSNILITGAIWALLQFIDAIRDGDKEAALLSGTIGIFLVLSWAALNAEMLKTVAIKIAKFFSSIADVLTKVLIPSLQRTRTQVAFTNIAFAAFAASLAYVAISKYWSSEESTARKMITTFTALALAITAAAIAYNAFAMNWAQALSVAGLVAGGVFTVSGALSGIDMFANGGLPDKGTMFVAGEAGAEIVYNTPSGQSGVVNVQQIKSAMYQALVEYGNSHSGGNEPIIIKIGEEEVFRATRKSAKKQGLDFVKV